MSHPIMFTETGQEADQEFILDSEGVCYSSFGEGEFIPWPDAPAPEIVQAVMGALGVDRTHTLAAADQ